MSALQIPTIDQLRMSAADLDLYDLAAADDRLMWQVECPCGRTPTLRTSDGALCPVCLDKIARWLP